VAAPAALGRHRDERQRLPVTTYPLRLAAPLALVHGAVLPGAAGLVLAFVSFYADPGMTQWGTLAQAWGKMFDAFGMAVLGDTLWLGAAGHRAEPGAGLCPGLDLSAPAERVQPLVIFIVMLPLLTSVVVRTFAWIVILGRQGIVNALLGDLG
jgi:putative spermidine/putrescine transport system permease protein